MCTDKVVIFYKKAQHTLGQFGDLLAVFSCSSKHLILWDCLLCSPPKYLTHALCRQHTHPHTWEEKLLPRTYENSLVRMQLSRQVGAPWQLKVQSLRTHRLLDKCLDVVFLREQSCKPDLELDAVTVSPHISAHIVCKVHKMQQTTNNLTVNSAQCLPLEFSPTFTCRSQLLCPSLRSRGQVLFPRRLMNCFHFQTYFSDK